MNQTYMDQKRGGAHSISLLEEYKLYKQHAMVMARLLLRRASHMNTADNDMNDVAPPTIIYYQRGAQC